MNGIARIIDSLNNSPWMISILAKNAEDHIELGVTETFFTISIFLILGFAWNSASDSIVDPDPLTGLTARDKYLVTNSFKAVRKTPLEHGMGILLLFFRKYPDAQKLFPFRDIPIGSLSSSPQFRKHSLAVMNGITHIIDSLDKSAWMISIVGKNAEAHIPRGVTETFFTQLEGTIIEYLSPLLNAEEISAWKKILKAVFDVMRGVVRNKNIGK
ncbi:hypothetical protein JTB14_017361 [Gonioctena quinquepunctata]|nr:hypothetical protein JTB14_017361 [Gonioctena quinquepunctata]